jgi:hypothetical protein
MENFRDFFLGPDPFGRTWHVLFKYLQTAISIRHSDSVDVCFILTSGDERMLRTVVLQHADLRAFSQRKGRKMDDAWCARLAYCKLKEMIETAEDLDKEYLLVTPAEIAAYDELIRQWEDDYLRRHAA